MALRACLAVSGFVWFAIIATADQPSRMISHMYQSEGILVTISFVDLPSGPVCHIDDGRVSSASFKVRDFPISKQQFEHFWSVTRELAPFQVNEKSTPNGDALNDVVFASSESRDGEKKIFLIPKGRASKTVADIAHEIRAYARD